MLKPTGGVYHRNPTPEGDRHYCVQWRSVFEKGFEGLGEYEVRTSCLPDYIKKEEAKEFIRKLLSFPETYDIIVFDHKGNEKVFLGKSHEK